MKKQNKKLTAKQQKTIGIAAIVVAIIITALIIWLVGVPLVKFASQPEKFREWINDHGVGGRAAYMGMVIFQVIIAVLPGEPFEIAGGYAFGAVEGTILCIIASTMGSMLVFWLVRRYGTKLVKIFFSGEKLKTVKFLKMKEKRDLLYLIIFMLPGTPKDLLSYAAGLTDVSVPVWLLICSLGRIPSIITSTVGGDALGTKNYWFAVIVFAVTLAVSAAGLLIYNRICSHHKNKNEG